MGKQLTEMLKGTLEGLVLAFLSGRSAYGYEITAWLRDQGFADIAEGTVYALLIRIEQRGLVDVEKVPSEKGPPERSTPSTLPDMTTSTSSGGRGASWQNDWNSSAKEAAMSNPMTKLIGDKRRWRAYKARVKALPPNYRTAVEGIQRYLMYFGALDADSANSLFEDVADLFERAAADGTPIREIVGDDPVEFVDDLIRNYRKGGYIEREQQKLIQAIDEAAGDR